MQAPAEVRDNSRDYPVWIERRSLLRRLDSAAGNRVTVIRAPAGFGKSALLRQWIAHSGDRSIATLEFQERDETSAVRSSPAGTLVIEGIDSPDLATTSASLQRIIRGLPLSTHLVLVGRAVPLALVEEAAGASEVCHFGAEDLVFTRAEAKRLLREVAGPYQSAEELDALMNETGGWPAGLHLAAIGLREHPETHRYCVAQGYVEGYFSDVVEAQPKELREFLLATSALDTMSPSLCEAVVGEGGAAALQYVEDTSLFIERADGAVAAFRYHPMFLSFLRSRARACSSAKRSVSLHAAADWYLASGDIQTAGRYLVDAEAWERLMDLAMERPVPSYSGGPGVVLDLLRSVPLAIRRSRRDLALQEAVLQTMSGDTLGAEATLGGAIGQLSLTSSEKLLMSALRMLWIEQHANPDSAISAANDVLTASDEEIDELPVVGVMASNSLRSRARLCVGRAQWFKGDVSEAQETLRLAVEESRGHSYVHVCALGALGLAYAWVGRLGEAKRLASTALALASKLGWELKGCTTSAHLAMGCALRERGSLSKAQAALDRAHCSAASAKQAKALAVHAVEQALLDLALGKPTEGLSRLTEFSSRLRLDPPPAVASRLRCIEARLWLASGDSVFAQQLIDACTAENSDLRAAAVELAVRRHDVLRARSLVDAWDDFGQIRARLIRKMWTALVEDLEGSHREARRRLEEAISLAESEEFVQVFLDAGVEMGRLLRSVERWHPSAYLRRLVGETDRCDDRPATPVLSERELMVLRYLPSPLPNSEIAEHLFVSLNTVKTHIRKIYQVLEVHDRQEAVERAVAQRIV